MQLPGLPPENVLLTPTELSDCGRSNSQSMKVVSSMKCFLSGFEAVPQPAPQFAVSRTDAPVSEPPLKRTREKVQPVEPCACVEAPQAGSPLAQGVKVEVSPAALEPSSSPETAEYDPHSIGHRSQVPPPPSAAPWSQMP